MSAFTCKDTGGLIPCPALTRMPLRRTLPWLFSGGAGDLALAVSDINTGQLVQRYTGHNDQVLGAF